MMSHRTFSRTCVSARKPAAIWLSPSTQPANNVHKTCFPTTFHDVHRSTVAACTPVKSSDGTRENGQQKLVELVDSLMQSINHASRADVSTVAAAIQEITDVAHQHGLDVVDEANNIGSFKGILTTDTRGVTVDNETNLGRLAFNKFGPVDLKVVLESPPEQSTWATPMPNQLKGDFEGVPNSYVVPAIFKVIDPRDHHAADQDPLYGISSAIGNFSLCPENPGRLIVTFCKLRLQLAPHLASKPAALQRWLDLLKDSNPGMGDNGLVEIDLGTPPKGSLDYLMMTRNLQISKGNLGSVVILRREGA